MAGKVAANPGTNVQIAAGLGIFFKEKGSANWLDLGAITGVNFELSTEFLEYFQNRRGANALTRRFVQSKGFTVSGSLEESTPENLRLAFLGGDITAASDPSYVLETATLTVASGAVTLPETASVVDRVVSSSDFQSSSLTHTFSGPGTAVTITDSSVSDGDEVVVTYQVQIAAPANNAKTFRIGENSTIEGEVEVRIRQQGGGIGFAINIPDCEIAPNGTIDISSDSVQAFPIILTARETNGAFATAVVYDQAA